MTTDAPLLLRTKVAICQASKSALNIRRVQFEFILNIDITESTFVQVSKEERAENPNMTPRSEATYEFHRQSEMGYLSLFFREVLRAGVAVE
jgi:hypothetical protein